jgi:[protein-PII] uridylyltransferase
VSVDELTDDYLLSFPPEVVAQHVVAHRDNYRLLRQKSLVYASEKEGQWSLLIMSSDQPGLLAKICGVMTLNNLTVLNAQIFTWSDGTVVDVLDVRPTDGLGYDERDWAALNVELDLAITYRLGLSHRLYKKLAAVQARKKDLVSRHKPRVIINNDASTTFTVIEVYGNDREGQLYRVTQTFADFGINIHKAFIATEVERSIDVFYVLDRGGNKIEESEFKGEIVEGVLHCISGNERKK